MCNWPCYTLPTGKAPERWWLPAKPSNWSPRELAIIYCVAKLLLRMKREKEAADSARYVAERWHGPDHNEAVALWYRIPAASRPADAIVVEEVEEQSQAAEGKMLSIACGEKSKNEVTLQRGDDLMVFKSKGRQMIGYSDTLWYGSDHFSLCHHVEGMHAVVRYRPAVS